MSTLWGTVYSESEVSVGKDSKGEYRSGQYSLDECSVSQNDIAYSMGGEYITSQEYEKLTHTFTKAVVDVTINRIIAKPYRNCLNYDTVYKWCEEYNGRVNNYTLAGMKKVSSEYEDVISSLESGGGDSD